MVNKKSKTADNVKTRARRVATKRAPEKSIKQVAPKRGKKKSELEIYDAEQSFGMIPGLVERMAEYLRTMRDDH